MVVELELQLKWQLYLIFRSINKLKSLLLWVLTFAPIFSNAQISKNKTGKLVSGIVIDINTKEALNGANISNLLEKKIYTTKNNGGFQFKTYLDSTIIKVSFLGYETKEILITNESYIIIELNSISIFGDAVVVTAQILKLQEINQISSIRLTPVEINSIPMQFGQRDILKSFQYYPGVQMGIEGSSGIHVRGGSVDQTEILIDGIPIFNPYHSGGFISTFHSSTIREAELLSAGFPAIYGGRLGSYLDIKLKNGSKTDWHSEINTGIISADAFIEGPLLPNLSIVAAGRLNTLNNNISLFDRDVQKIIPENQFWDAFLKLNWQINSSHQLNSIFFKSIDFESNGFNTLSKDSISNNLQIAKNQQKISTDWTNSMLGVQHNYNPNNFLNSKSTIYITDYNYGTLQNRSNHITSNNQLATFNQFKYSTNSSIREYGIISYWFLSFQNYQFNFGAGKKYLQTKNNITESLQSNSKLNTTTSLFNPNVDSHSYFGYSELEINLFNSLLLKTGIRLNTYQLDDEYLNNLNTRISLRYLFTESYSIKVSYSETDQFLHLLSNSGFNAQSDIWISSNKTIRPEQSSIIALGLYHTTSKWEFSTEIYYRSLTNIIEPVAGFDFFTSDIQLSDRLSQGVGNAKGWETLIKKRIGKLNGFISYTLSNSNRQFDDINNNKSFPYKYDRRHNLTTNWNIELTKHFSLSASWTYLSGYYLTIPDVALITEYSDPYSLNSITITTFSHRNNQRIADYHRLDLSGTYLQKLNRIELGLTAGAFNVYSRKNHAFWSIDPTVGYFSDTELTNDAYKVRVNVFLLFPIQPFVSIYAKF